MAHNTSSLSFQSSQEECDVQLDTAPGFTMQKNGGQHQWVQQWLSNAPSSTEHHLKSQCLLMALQLKLSQ